MASILSKDGKSIQPQAFKLNSAKLINFSGEEIGIANMLSQIKIRESIFLPTLIMEITLKDAINFLELYQLSGQERILLDFERVPIHDPKQSQQIQLEFYVTEYSAFAKSPTNASIQGYTMKGIAPYAYNSKFIKISRAYSNNSSSEISKILRNDLFYDNFVLNGTDATTHTGILNIQEPLAAIEYLRKAAFDDKAAPFFFYQTLKGVVNLSSLSWLNDKEKNPVVNDYVFLKGYHAAPFSPDDYVERASRILDTQSNLEMSKIFQAADGGYASNNWILDIKTKTYTNKIYDYAAESNSVLRNNNLAGTERKPYADAFKIGRDNKNSLNNLPEAHQEFIATNTGAFGNQQSYNSDMAENIEALNSYTALMNTIAQTISLCGDFNLNAGKKIGLLYPRAIESKAYKAISPETYSSDELDQINSGTYLITSAIHTFEFGREGGDEHYTDLEVRKDTIF